MLRNKKTKQKTFFKKINLNDTKLFSILYEENETLSLYGGLNLKHADYSDILKIINDKNQIALNLYFDTNNNGDVVLHTNDDNFLNSNFICDLGGKIGVIFIDKKTVRNMFDAKRVTKEIIEKIKSDMSSYLKKITYT